MKFSRYIFYWLSLIVKFGAGSHLLSHTVSSAVPSAAYVLTVVFGMGTGVSPKRIATRIRVTQVSAHIKLICVGSLLS